MLKPMKKHYYSLCGTPCLLPLIAQRHIYKNISITAHHLQMECEKTTLLVLNVELKLDGVVVELETFGFMSLCAC